MRSAGRPRRSMMVVEQQPVVTNIPQRLDRLPSSKWHIVMVAALGITWLLDGLQVTLAGSLASILKDKNAPGLSDVPVGASATGYLAGAVLGALFFGWLTDRLGRKKRKSVPESPRWPMLRGHEDEATQIVDDVEHRVRNQKGDLPEPEGEIKIRVRDHTPLADVWKAMIRSPRSSLLPHPPRVLHTSRSVKSFRSKSAPSPFPSSMPSERLLAAPAPHSCSRGSSPPIPEAGCSAAISSERC